ncbi:SMP-30/gluconolactonase/LRE family protein [Paracoccus homiensis]|uniref:SMP-30/gluconolactonase/LRE family protein n=1 Tax=Paracoccus homiensis TaxID=364199 RepID=UPI00398CA492
MAPQAGSDWARVQHPGKHFRAFLEGPSFDRDGNLFCVDISHGRILKCDPQGNISVAVQYDGEPNGLKIHKDGRIFIADHAHGLMVLDPVSGKIEPFLTRPGLERFHGLNDLHFAANGDLYFTDQGQSGLHSAHGRLFRLTQGGDLDCLIDNIPSPNGLVLNTDEDQLYLAVTRMNAVWRVRFLPGGRTVAKTGTFIQLSGATFPRRHSVPDRHCFPKAGSGRRFWILQRARLSRPSPRQARAGQAGCSRR